VGDRHLAAEESVVNPPDSTRDLSTEDFLYHLYRGSELLQENRILEAKEELEQALTMQPADAKGQDLLGAVYFRLGLYPRAIQIWEGLEAQFPGDVSIKINLALCYLKTGQPEPARRVLREVVQINPGHKRAWGYLGLALQKLGELEQAQIAFEKGDRPTMARKVTEARRSLAPPTVPDSSPPEIAEGVREMADAAFSELDTGELRFALAEPAPTTAGDGQWHTLEIGGTRKSKSPPKSPFTKTLPPPWMGAPEPQDLESAPPPSISFSAPPVPRFPRVSDAIPILPIEPPMAAPAPIFAAEEPERLTAPPLLSTNAEPRITWHASGVVRVRTTDVEGQAFAARLEALRVVAGSATTRVLHRRTRDTDTGEVLGGLGSPFVRVSGEAQLVLGARPQHQLTLLSVDDNLAFVREELLAGFELALHYENGRIPLEPGGGDEALIVQLRGSGTFVLDVPGDLATLPSGPEKPLIARREWIVGWFGRLVTRALSATEAPGGHRGLIGFWGEGMVLVCVG
jgi:hypothetical protein